MQLGSGSRRSRRHRRQISLSSLVASRHPVESCRQNGLPLTPNSIAVLGQAQALKSLSHPHLCSVLDVQRVKGERVIVASEYHAHSLASLDPAKANHQDFLYSVVAKQWEVSNENDERQVWPKK